MKPLLASFFALICAVALVGTVQAQSAEVLTAAASVPGVRFKAREVEVRARVVEIDTTARAATLRGPRGRLVTVAVPPEVKNFDQMKAGDDVVVRYLTAVVAKLEKTRTQGIRERSESVDVATAEPGALPGVAVLRTVEVLAIVRGLDRKARTATLQGVHRTVQVVVPEGIDLSKIKRGDEVRARVTEATVVSVEPALAP